mmetsp:Transcript_368/g.1013  ORF Transcript_368/g.1013 Transcript_368/m.1013 type:complete len:202 (+) Transcript_368:362-967(+)
MLYVAAAAASLIILVPSMTISTHRCKYRPISFFNSIDPRRPCCKYCPLRGRAGWETECQEEPTTKLAMRRRTPRLPNHPRHPSWCICERPIRPGTRRSLQQIRRLHHPRTTTTTTHWQQYRPHSSNKPIWTTRRSTIWVNNWKARPIWSPINPIITTVSNTVAIGNSTRPPSPRWRWAITKPRPFDIRRRPPRQHPPIPIV